MFKKTVFYLIVAFVIFGGQFFINRGLISGVPPQINSRTMDGQEVMSRIEKGPALIYFWAEWCGICNMMKASIASVLKDYPGFTVSVRSGNDLQVRQYLNRHQLDWPVVNDRDSRIAKRYGVEGVPVLFFVNPEGKIIFSAVGFTSETGIRFRLMLVDILSF